MKLVGHGYEQGEVREAVGIPASDWTRAETITPAALRMRAPAAEPAAATPRETREIRARADGLEMLLVAWVDECLYVHEIEAFVVSRVEVGACSDTVVHGRLHGEPLDPARHRLGTVVKAATLHGVSVQAREGHHEVKIIVDV